MEGRKGGKKREREPGGFNEAFVITVESGIVRRIGGNTMGRVSVTRDDRTVSADAVKNGNASVTPRMRGFIVAVTEESHAAVFRLNSGDVT